MRDTQFDKLMRLSKCVVQNGEWGSFQNSLKENGVITKVHLCKIDGNFMLEVFKRYNIYIFIYN